MRSKWIYAAVLVVVVAVAAGWWYFSDRLETSAPAEARFSLFEGGEVMWYTLKPDGSVARADGPVGYGPGRSLRHLTEALPSGDRVAILDSAQGDFGSDLAIMRTDGTLIPLVNDAASKYAPSIGSGRVVYSSYADLKMKNGTVVGDWQLVSVALYDSSAQPLALGPGFSSAFAADGGLVAVAPEGLVRVNPTKGGRFMIIDRPGIPYGVAAVAPDAMYAVLPNSVTHALDIFSISIDDSGSASYVASVPGEASAVTFLDGDTFVMKTTTAFSVHTVERGSVVTNSIHTYAP